MKKLIAALDDTPMAGSVLAAAGPVAKLLGARVEPVHVVEDGDSVVRAQAATAGMPLRVTMYWLPSPMLSTQVAARLGRISSGASETSASLRVTR